MWLARLEREQENLWAALDWLIEREEAELALRFCGALWRFWHLRGYWSEGRRWLAKALALPQTQAPTVARAKALTSAGDLAYNQDDYAVASSLLEESVTLCRSLGAQRELATALGVLGILIYMQGDSAAARPLLEESITLCRKLNSKWELSYVLRRLGQLIRQEGDLGQASTLIREALTLAQELGDKYLIATALIALSLLTQMHSDLVQTEAYVQESLLPAEELKDKYLIAIALNNLGYIQALQGDLIQATGYAQQSLAVIREVGDKMFTTNVLDTLGHLATLQGQLEQASAYYREGLFLAQEIGNATRVGRSLNGLAEVAAAEGQPMRAAQLLGAAEARFDVKGALSAVEFANYERLVEKVRTQLGEKVFTATWAAGRTLTAEQVLAAPAKSPIIVDMRAAEPSVTPLLTAPASPPQSKAPRRAKYPVGLTAREVEVLEHLAQGLTDVEIADRLVISERTVGKHLENIFQKIGVKTRGAAIRFAMENGLV
jgi:ATP/maltotriose-dependent transcriptional regulator MalT